jgi:hypothetical protein
MNEIDALTAGLLPLLVPGLKVGGGMKVTDRGTLGKGKRGKLSHESDAEFGGLVHSGEFSSPDVHSNPRAARRHPAEPRARKMSAHKRNHLSLPR